MSVLYAEDIIVISRLKSYVFNYSRMTWYAQFGEHMKTWRTCRLFAGYISMARNSADGALDQGDITTMKDFETELKNRQWKEKCEFYRSLSDPSLKHLYATRILGMPSC